MPRVSDILLPLWCLYITVMIVASWFGPDVNSFEDWMFSVIAWWLAIVAGFAVRGRD